MDSLTGVRLRRGRGAAEDRPDQAQARRMEIRRPLLADRPGRAHGRRARLRQAAPGQRAEGPNCVAVGGRAVRGEERREAGKWQGSSRCPRQRGERVTIMFSPSPHPFNFLRHWRPAQSAGGAVGGRKKMSAGSCLISVIIGVSILLISNTAPADKIPGTAYVGPQYYFTTEMDPIDLVFRSKPEQKVSTPPLERFRIPRAYIFFVPGKSRESGNKLPKKLSVNAVQIILTYPNGQPYSHTVRDYARTNGVSEATAAKKIRSRTMISRISVSKNNAYELSYLEPPRNEFAKKYEKPLGTYSGLARFKTGGSAEIYYASSDALVRKIQCWNSPEKALRNTYCKYYVVLNKRLVAWIDFVDFRVNGGIAFAEERIRVFKETICQYVRCDRKP